MLNLLSVTLFLLSALSLLLTIWQWMVARKFPLHERVKDRSFAPPVTVLKPLKGCDSETRRCLQSWLEQDYAGGVQILFGVASKDDPVCEIVRELMEKNPKADAQLVICKESLGPNAKVSTLTQLERSVKNEVIIVSDADVYVPNDFLANVMQPLHDPNVGLVNCFYRFANPSTLAMQWEAIAVNADFWSQVLQSQSLKPMDFALGAVMATRREQIKAIGGFESLVDYLADDYRLGNQIARTGKRIVISPVVVECWEAKKGWKEIWKHQLRWARTIRVCQPVPFFFSILSNATLWPCLYIITQPFIIAIESTQLGPKAFSTFVQINSLSEISLVFLAARIASGLSLQTRLTKNAVHFAYWWLVPIKDLLNVGIWALAFIGNHVEWRGEKFRVWPGGKLVKD